LEVIAPASAKVCWSASSTLSRWSFVTRGRTPLSETLLSRQEAWITNKANAADREPLRLLPRREDRRSAAASLLALVVAAGWRKDREGGWCGRAPRLGAVVALWIATGKRWLILKAQ